MTTDKIKEKILKEIKIERAKCIEEHRRSNSPQINIYERIKRIEAGEMGYGRLPLLQTKLQQHEETSKAVKEEFEKMIEKLKVRILLEGKLSKDFYLNYEELKQKLKQKEVKEKE